MSVTICQSMGFVVSALGVGGIIASTCMDQWSTQDLYNNPVTAVFNYQGLWRTCVRDSSGFTECRGYFTILGLPGLRLHCLSRGDIMSTTICQVMGFLVSSLGVAGCIVSTAMDSWSTQDLYDNPVTAVFQYQGLWRSCVRQSSGFTECRPYFTILGLPAMFQAVRALMIVGIVLGILGLLVCIFALKCIRIGTMEDSAKANMTLTSGIMFIIAGLCAITGVSVFANMLVTNFWMSTANMYQGMQNIQNRYTFGSALFVGWVAGGLALVGGILMCLACRGLIPEETRYKAVSYNASGPNISYRTGPYKVASGYEPETKARKSAGYEEAARSEDGRRSYPSKYDYV